MEHSRIGPVLLIAGLSFGPSVALAHGKKMPKAEAGAAPTVALGTKNAGQLRLSGSATQGAEELEIEVKIERHIEPPDPVLGSHVPVPEAAVTLKLTLNGGDVAPPTPAHSEAEAGVFGAHFKPPPAGEYLVVASVALPDSSPVSVDFPLSISRQQPPVAEAEAVMMTHPFLAHMGMPDPPGGASVRVTGIRRAGELGAGNDAAFHVEAGILPRLGLHLRNDAITNAGAGTADEAAEDHGSELMLQFAIFQNADGSQGISIFGEVSWPTVRGDGPSVRGGAGVSGAVGWANRVLLDANVHVSPTASEVEVSYEAALQFRPAGRIYALVENRGEFSPEHTTIYLLPAVKIGLGSSAATVGLGVQFPLTTARQYERQVMFQLDWEF
ncbi:MAG: hypothetical protein ACOZIN_19205 [Myxococcota bacterium]